MTQTLPIRRTEHCIELEGIEGFLLSEMGNSVVGAVTRACDALGQPTPYFELLGRSAQAFRVQMDREFCPSSPHSMVGASTMDLLQSGAPLGMVDLRAENPPEEEIRDAVRAEIEAGRPVLYGNEECGLVVGVEPGAFVCVHPYTWKRDRFRLEEVPWCLLGFRERTEPVDGDRALHRALVAAVRMWEQGDSGRYLLGRAAWDHWIEAVETSDEPRFAGLSHGGFWVYDQLIEARRAAANFLDGHGVLPDVADIFRAMVDEMTPEGAGAVEICRPSWSLEHPPTPEARSRYVECLKRARSHDEQAFLALSRWISTSRMGDASLPPE